MVLDNIRIDAAQGKLAGQAVSHDQAVERIASPAQIQSLLNQRDRRRFVDHESQTPKRSGSGGILNDLVQPRSGART
ncbi:MAG: hypothetical protein DMG13_21940 [Acidobacteria bacterium]|nr:MAG: hypothetical protein DMG13_21940 [Acidobacteriota bacterium]